MTFYLRRDLPSHLGGITRPRTASQLQKRKLELPGAPARRRGGGLPGPGKQRPELAEDGGSWKSGRLRSSLIPLPPRPGPFSSPPHGTFPQDSVFSFPLQQGRYYPVSDDSAGATTPGLGMRGNQV